MSRRAQVRRPVQSEIVVIGVDVGKRKLTARALAGDGRIGKRCVFGCDREGFEKLFGYAQRSVQRFGVWADGSFAWIEDDNRRNDDSSAGFLVNFGFGIELELTPFFFVGSQMSFNFLPERTLGQDFFYAWQVGGLRVAF